MKKIGDESRRSYGGSIKKNGGASRCIYGGSIKQIGFGGSMKQSTGLCPAATEYKNLAAEMVLKIFSRPGIK